MGYKTNIASNLANQVIRLVIGALTGIIVARVLGPRGQGYAAYIILVFTLIGDYGHFGLNNAVIYFQKRSSYPPGRVFSVNLTALGLVFLVIAAVAIGLRFAKLALASYSWPYIAGGLLFVASDLVLTNHQAWFVGDERITASNRLQIQAFLVKSAAILALWLAKALTPATFFAAVVFGVAVSALLLHSRVGRKYRPQLDFGLLKREYSYGLIIWLSAAFCFLLYRVDQFMIRRILGVSELGVYSVSVSLAELMFLIPLSINSALLGRLYNTPERTASRKVLAQTFKLSLYICVALALAGIPLCLLIPLLYGASYSGAVACTVVLLAGTAFASLAIVSAQYYFTINRPVLHLIGSLAALLLNVALNLLLIPALGILGAALASAASYLVFGLYYLGLLLWREKFSASELLALRPADIRELWRKK